MVAKSGGAVRAGGPGGACEGGNSATSKRVSPQPPGRGQLTSLNRIAAHLVVNCSRRQCRHVTAGGSDRKNQAVRVGRPQYWRLWVILGKPRITAGHHEAGLREHFIVRSAAGPTQAHLRGRHAGAGKLRGLRKQSACISHIASQSGDDRNLLACGCRGSDSAPGVCPYAARKRNGAGRAFDPPLGHSRRSAAEAERLSRKRPAGIDLHLPGGTTGRSSSAPTERGPRTPTPSAGRQRAATARAGTSRWSGSAWT